MFELIVVSGVVARITASDYILINKLFQSAACTLLFFFTILHPVIIFSYSSTGYNSYKYIQCLV